MKVAILTSGGLAPCLSAAVGCLIQRYHLLDPKIEIIAYLHGYQGLLLGKSTVLSDYSEAPSLLNFGGSPIGNSRVKLSNASDCEKKGLIASGANPFEVAAQQLITDHVDVLHTIGGDDTSTTAAELAHFLKQHNYPLTIVGLPKTIDNDINPIQLSLGATTAAEQGAIFFEHVVNEHTANPKTLVVHEVMGRHCGWLTYETARQYTERLQRRTFAPHLGFLKEAFEIHALYIPEIDIQLDAEIARLQPKLDHIGSLNIFVSEGACANVIVQELERSGQAIERDAFGHVKLDKINAGQWIGERLAKRLGAKKLLVQKSGYFARSSQPNAFDLNLIQAYVDYAVECAFNQQSGLIGQDERFSGQLRCIEFEAISGGKPLTIKAPAIQNLLKAINS